jgi:hypothetical protein
VQKKVLIATPFPSLDDVAKELGISKSRQKKIEKMMEGIIAARSSERGGRTHKGLDGRDRDKDGTIDRKNGNTRVATLRETYGEDFGKEVRGNAKLKTLLERTGDETLNEYLRRKRA